MINTLKETITAFSSLHWLISAELESQGIPLVPILTFQIIQPTHSDPVLFDQTDIQKLCSYYGEVLNVQVKGQEAVVHFQSLNTAYFVQRTLNNKYIEELGFTLLVNWNRNVPISKNLTKSDTLINILEYKYTCKYLIDIRNCNDFQVSRRIIGPKGKNMKKIIESCVSEKNLLKLRLRGQGSGFKEGPTGAECEEPLHLCVSCKNYEVFLTACAKTKELIEAIYQDFDIYLKKKGQPSANLTVRIMN